LERKVVVDLTRHAGSGGGNCDVRGHPNRGADMAQARSSPRLPAAVRWQVACAVAYHQI